jgi:phospholipase A2
MCSRKLLHLVDAGLAINSPYPLLLPPAWEVQLILSFDFSDGDPFEVTEKGLGEGVGLGGGRAS